MKSAVSARLVCVLGGAVPAMAPMRRCRIIDLISDVERLIVDANADPNDQLTASEVLLATLTHVAIPKTNQNFKDNGMQERETHAKSVEELVGHFQTHLE